MAVTVQNLGRVDGANNGVTRQYKVANGATVYVGEFVYLDQSTGRVTSASIAGKRLLGTVVGRDDAAYISGRTLATSATGDAGGTVTVLVDIEPQNRYLMKADNVTNTLDETDQGKYYNLIGSPGSQLVGMASESTSSGQVVCLRTPVTIRGVDATYGLFKIVQSQLQQ